MASRPWRARSAYWPKIFEAALGVAARIESKSSVAGAPSRRTNGRPGVAVGDKALIENSVGAGEVTELNKLSGLRVGSLCGNRQPCRLTAGVVRNLAHARGEALLRCGVKPKEIACRRGGINRRSNVPPAQG